MHASLHRVTKITIGKITPLRDDGAEVGPILSYVRYITVEYDDNARLELVCHNEEHDVLYADIK